MGSGRPEQPTPSFSDKDAGRFAWLAYLHLSSDFQRFRLLGDLLSVSQLFFSSPFSHSFFLSLEFRFNINSNKTSLAIAYSVFQELSTAHRDNRPIQEFYTIMRTIGTSSPPWRRSSVLHILPVAVPRSSRGPEISNVYFIPHAPSPRV